MNYNKDFIELLSELSAIQTQLIFEETENNLFNVRANNSDTTVCYKLIAPKSYFDFPGSKIGFFDFSKFCKYFNIFDKVTKDPATSNTPKLDIETNAAGNGVALHISSSIDSRSFVNRLGDPDVIAKPQFGDVGVPSVDAELSLSAADIIDLKSMIGIVSADNVKFEFHDNVCTTVLSNTFSGDTYSSEYTLAYSVKAPFEFTVPKSGIMPIPSSAYHLEICSRGLIKFTQLREDEIKLAIYITKKK